MNLNNIQKRSPAKFIAFLMSSNFKYKEAEKRVVQFLTYDQAEFFYTSLPVQSSMDDSGHVYIPSGCVDKSTGTRNCQ